MLTEQSLAPKEEFRKTALIYEAARVSLFRGRRVGDDSPVVLKVLRPNAASVSDIERLRQEFTIAKKLAGLPEVVQVSALTLIDGLPGLVLEDFDGVSLAHLAGRGMEISRFLRLAISMARALEAVHATAVVHRDIKPENFIYDAKTDLVKLTDFGISTVLKGGSALPSGSGTISGTLAYVSPEQTGRMNRSVDYRTDFYSLGISFYQLLAGTLPFHAGDALEWVHCHIARSPRPLPEVRPDIPSSISKIVHRLMAKLAEDRYQSAYGLRSDLECCLEQWEKRGRVSHFDLGKHDISGHFQLPLRLYGRERDLVILSSALERSREKGTNEVILICGPSGIGKSSMVLELYRPIVASRGIFVSGKYDQYQKHVPYSTLIQALRELIQNVLSEPEARFSEWKARLQDVLGAGGAVMAELVPELEMILGKQPPSPRLNSAQSQNRFELALRALISCFARPGRPLVLFLDDMQWADQATLNALESLAGAGGVPNFLLVLAYRDGEVPTHHPLALLLHRMRGQGQILENLRLQPFGFPETRALLGDAFRGRPGAETTEVAELAGVVLEKTSGNPFFTGEFLKSLVMKELIRFDDNGKQWRWDGDKLRDAMVTDNVIDLLIERMMELTPYALQLLKLASCIGHTFDLDTVRLISGAASTDEVGSELAAAQELGLLWETPAVNPGSRNELRFQHDRVQQAAYAMIPEKERAAAHAKIGFLLLQQLSQDQLDSRIFEVVNQLNYADSGPLSAPIRERLFTLNLAAARKAKESAAYETAYRHFSLAANLGPPEAGGGDPVLFALQLDRAECAYLCGKLNEAQSLFAECVAKSASDLDRVHVYYLQISLFQVAGEYQQALEISLQAFALLGLRAPDTGSSALEVERELARADELLRGCAALDLLDAPLMHDARLKALSAVLEASGPPVYMLRPDLFPWVTLKLLNLSLENGNSRVSPYAYGIYAIMLAASFGQGSRALEFSELAIRLNEKFNDPRLKGCMLHLLGDHVNFWVHPIATDLPILERGFRACLEGGDLVYANYIASQSVWHAWEKGDPLDQVLLFAEKNAQFAKHSRHEANFLTIRLEQQFLKALQGKLPSSSSLTDHEFDANQALSTIEKSRYSCGIVFHHVLETVLHCFFGRYDLSLAAAAKAEVVLGAAYSMPLEIAYHFFRTLSLASTLHSGAIDQPTAETGISTVRAQVERFRAWKDQNLCNFEHKWLILAAELALLEGRNLEASQLFERAVVSARTYAFPQYEALAHERAAIALRKCQLPNAAESHLLKAKELFERWGARAKAEQVAPLTTLPVAATTSFGVTDVTLHSQLDFVSILKASQAISEEIEPNFLFPALLRVALEAIGADRGVLILTQGENLHVVSEAFADRSRSTKETAVEWLTSRDPECLKFLPCRMVELVRRTGKAQLLGNAENEHQFSSDPYFSTRKTKSVLCLPLNRKGSMVGIIFLENTLLSDAFNSRRLRVMELLSAQMTISIENSELFRNLQRAVRARDEFMTIASHELKTPLTSWKLKTQMNLRRLSSLPANGNDDDFRNFLTDTDRNINRLTRLVEDMLDISKIELGIMSIQPTKFDLRPLVEEVVDRLAPLVQRSACTVAVRGDSMLVGNWDRDRIEQIISNLVTNALKYGAGNPVEIRLKRSEGSAVLEVCDQGKGIALEDRDRIFERYERATSANEVSGLGLGLFIARQIAQMHGGEVNLQSDSGKGSCFSLRLPLAPI